VLTRLSNALEHASAPGEVVPNLAATVGQALKIPYVAIQIDQNGECRIIAAYGKPQLATGGPQPDQ
jgi:two-component system, NarL family, sensor kinase